MQQPKTVANDLNTALDDLFSAENLIYGVLSGSQTKAPDDFRKVVIKPILLRGARAIQFEYHFVRKVTHRNLPRQEAKKHICELLVERFRQAEFQTTSVDIVITFDKTGHARIRRTAADRDAPDLRHDRPKGYLIPEGEPCDFMARLGVMTESGRVIAAKYDKFRQINRFLEIVADVADNLDSTGPIRVVDFGCGKSYLTFALYHYLHYIKHLDVRIVGLDLKQDVVATCSRVAADLGFEHLEFAVGDIAGYAGLERADMVVSLHACDTATDDALAKAVAWGAQIILAVPCCQHELFRQIENPAMRPLLKHGIVKERLAALITDSLRAQALEVAGYAVQMLEFVDMEHTPKNLLIRAVKRNGPPNRERLQQEYRAFRDFWHARPSIDRIVEGREQV